MKRMEVKTCTIGENTYYINPFPAFTAGKAKVRDALGALTGDMSIMAQANVASPTTARTAMGSNSVSKSVVQNVNINNKFEGDRAGQQKSAAAMDKAAGDSTGEMARALSYAR